MRCYKPILLKIGEQVPCNRCYACRYNRTAQWSFRIQEEERRSSSSYFVTLTYSPENLPRCPKGRPTLRKQDMIKFMKRLRKLTTASGQKLKYYLVGEYGSQTGRPHYHAIIMNATEAQIKMAYHLDGKILGHLHFGDVQSASVGYTLKYMLKDYRRKYSDTRQPTFSIMSKGLGLSYLTDEIIKWYHSDLSRSYVQLTGGVKVPLPRYFKLRIFDNDQRRRQAAITDAAIAFAPHIDFDEIALYELRIKHALAREAPDLKLPVL